MKCAGYCCHLQVLNGQFRIEVSGTDYNRHFWGGQSLCVGRRSPDNGINAI